MDPTNIIDIVAQDQTAKADERAMEDDVHGEPWGDVHPGKAIGVIFGVTAGLMGLIWLVSRKRSHVVVPDPNLLVHAGTTPQALPATTSTDPIVASEPSSQTASQTVTVTPS